MENKNEKIVQELIEDNRFISWVKSDKQLHRDYWINWIKDHPEAMEPLKTAIRTVKLLQFKGTQVEPSLIYERWGQVQTELKRRSGQHKVRQIFSKIQSVAAILFLPLCILSFYFFYQNHQMTNSKQVIAEAQTGFYHTVEALAGSRVLVDLPDHSKVWLNSGSVLKYPASFMDDKREVEIQGEGYFEIKKSTTPFYVKNPGPTVKVYGTEFNLDTYSPERITLALVTGKVSVMHKKKEHFVKPGQLVEYNEHSEHLNIETTDLDEYTSWRNGYYIFRGKTLKYILSKMKYRYDCDFLIENPELVNERYNAKIKDLGLDQLLNYLSLIAPINYVIEEDKTNDAGNVKVTIKRKN